MTWNNPVECPQDWLELSHKQLKATYTVGQLEKGESGTVHLQFFMNFPGTTRMAKLKKHCNALHCEPVKVNNGADTYCMKEETRIDGPWQFGICPVKRSSKTDWAKVRQLAQTGQFDQIPDDIYIKHFSNLQKVHKANLQNLVDRGGKRGVWIYGPSGIGKSWKARTDYPDYYPKLCNKWWDGYNGQKNVIMDDIGPEHKCLGQQLKIWSDRYGCVLETKGGAISDDYENFVVTSQYTIREIFSEEKDTKTVDALLRRFKVVHMTFPYNNPQSPEPAGEEAGEM